MYVRMAVCLRVFGTGCFGQVTCSMDLTSSIIHDEVGANLSAFHTIALCGTYW
jgi:hypothetical protein